MSENQKMIGIENTTKQLIDENYKLKGFSTRAKYLKNLVEKDNPKVENVNPELIN